MASLIPFIIGIVGGIIMWGRLRRTYAAKLFAGTAFLGGTMALIVPPAPASIWPSAVCLTALFIILIPLTKPDATERARE